MTIGIDESAAVATLPGGDIPYTLRRSSRARTLRVVIHPDRGVVVTVPGGRRRSFADPEAHAARFLRERESWLRRHLAAQARTRAEIAARGGLADGALLPFRGVLHRLRIEPATGPRPARSSVERIGDGIEDTLLVRLGARDRRPLAVVLEAWFRARARSEIDRMIERHADSMGVRPAAVTLRDPRSRWGSASRAGRLSFSWRLVLAPPEALETVVIHELAHLRTFGHGPRFWAQVAARRPDHRTWRRWLHDHAIELHAVLRDPD